MGKKEMKLARAALAMARTQMGVREEPLGSNRGMRVDEYNLVADTFVDETPGAAWCLSFVYWCWARAAAGTHNPMPRTAYCPFLLDWARARRRFVSAPLPGDVFLLSREGRACHAGFVEDVDGERVTTIEGNTNEAGRAEGIGVFRRERATDGLAFVRF